MEGPRCREAEAEAREILRGRRGVREIARRLRGRCHRRSRAGSARKEGGARAAWGGGRERERGGGREGGREEGLGIKCARLSRGILLLLSSPAARSLGSWTSSSEKERKSRPVMVARLRVIK